MTTTNDPKVCAKCGLRFAPAILAKRGGCGLCEDERMGSRYKCTDAHCKCPRDPVPTETAAAGERGCPYVYYGIKCDADYSPHAGAHFAKIENVRAVLSPAPDLDAVMTEIQKEVSFRLFPLPDYGPQNPYQRGREDAKLTAIKVVCEVVPTILTKHFGGHP